MKRLLLLVIVSCISVSFSIPVKKALPEEEKKQNLNLLMIRYKIAQ